MFIGIRYGVNGAILFTTCLLLFIILITRYLFTYKFVLITWYLFPYPINPVYYLQVCPYHLVPISLPNKPYVSTYTRTNSNKQYIYLQIYPHHVVPMCYCITGFLLLVAPPREPERLDGPHVVPIPINNT